jgi:hypothetical protein
VARAALRVRLKAFLRRGVFLRHAAAASAVEPAEIDRSPPGLTPNIETIALGTLCRERDCEWRRSEQLGDIRKHFGRWRLKG